MIGLIILLNQIEKKSYKLGQVIFKTLGCFPSALFPKIWNSIELELIETKSAKSLKRKVAKICKKKTVYHVDKLRRNGSQLQLKNWLFDYLS